MDSSSDTELSSSSPDSYQSFPDDEGSGGKEESGFAVSGAADAWVGQTTKTIGSMSDWVGQTTQTIGATSDRVGQTTETIGSMSDWVGQTTGTIGSMSDWVGQTTGTIGSMSNWVGQTTGTIGSMSDWVGQTTQTVDATSDRVGQTTEMFGAMSDWVGQTTETIGTKTDPIGQTTETIYATSDPVGPHGNLPYDEVTTIGTTATDVTEDSSGHGKGLPVGAGAGDWEVSPEEKQKLSKASKELKVVSNKLKFFLTDTASRGKTIQKKLEKLESNKSEVEKALNEHVKYLHSLLDYYHSEQHKLLKQRHVAFLKQLMVHKTEELNFEAKLKDVQQKVENTLQRITKDHDVSAASKQHVADLCDEYHRRVSSRPPNREYGLTYLVEIPQVTADDVQGLLGHYLFTDSKQPYNRQPYPAPRYEGASAGHTPASRPTASSPSQPTAEPPKAASSPAQPSASKTQAAEATSNQKTGNVPTSSLRFSKENRAAKAHMSSREFSNSQRSAPSSQSKDSSASLQGGQKTSEMMGSSSSLASGGSAPAKNTKKRARSRKRQKQKKAEAKKEAAETFKPVMITLLHESARPKKIKGRSKQAKGFAPRPNGELWVVYGIRDPHLDRISETGDVLESCRIGGNAMHAASFSDENVLVSCHSPFCQLKLLDSKKESQETIKLPLIPTGLGVGSTGIVVSSYTSVYWIALDGGENEWIVKEKGSALKWACSCDVIILKGREIVCVADSQGHKVWFFEKLVSGEFTPLPLFTYASHNRQGKTVPFTPVCLSTLAGSSFLAVLDDESCSVLMVNVDKNEVVSVIAARELCEGTPSLVSFAVTKPGEDPKLWVASDTEEIYLVSLAFLY